MRPLHRSTGRPAARAAGLCGLLALLLVPLAATAAPTGDGQGPAADRRGIWRTTCEARGPAPACTVTARPSYADNRGGSGRVSVNLRHDSECTSLHVGFDRDIDVQRPVLLQIDDGPVYGFFTNRELSDLARAVDAGTTARPGDVAPEFAAFLNEVAAGSYGTGAGAAEELVARFAMLKESRRLGVACPSAERLLPLLRAGHVLRLSFHIRRNEPAAPYHWPAFDRREVTVSLEGLDELLETLVTVP